MVEDALYTPGGIIGRMATLVSWLAATWPRRRRLALALLVPVVAGGYLAVSGVSRAAATPTWLVLMLVAALAAAAVLATYVPAEGVRPDLGCTPCAAVSVVTVACAMIVLARYGAALSGPVLAIAVTLFGLVQRLGQPPTCAVEPSGRS